MKRAANVSMMSALMLLLACSIICVDSFVVPPPSINTHYGTNLVVLPSQLRAVTDDNNYDDTNEEEEEEDLADFKKSSRRKIGGVIGGGGEVDRRGALMSFLGGAISFAASDVLLGPATSGLLGGGIGGGGNAVLSSSIYSAKWNALYQRIASFVVKHESAAVASPELLSWISRTPAALVNPELRAWVAAQRAFSKSRQILGAAAVLEDGLATAAAATTVAAAAITSKQTSSDTTNDEDIDDPDTAETDTLPITHLSATNNTKEANELVKENTMTTKTTTMPNKNITASLIVEDDDSKEKEE